MDELFSLPPGSAGFLIASAVANTAGQITFLYAISLGSVGWTVTMTNSIFIPLSVLAGWLLLGDDVTRWTWVGGGAIMVGLYLLNRPARARAPEGGVDPRSGSTVGTGRVVPIATVMAVLSGVLWALALYSPPEALRTPV